jgi:hypothetical protein
MFETFEAADSEVSDAEVGKAPETVTKAPFDKSKLPGQGFPMGFWDPAQYTLDASEAQIKYYQEAELKHSRIAMLAFLGIVVGETMNPLFDGKITGPAIFQFQQADAIFPAFWVGVLMLVGWIEGQTIIDCWQDPSETFTDVNGLAKLRPEHIPGDLKFDPLNLMPKNEAKLTTMKTKELNNGRLAMIGVAGIVAQEFVSRTSVF